MKAKKVFAIVEDLDLGEKSQHQYPVWEFENGLILVPSDTTNDWFFQSWDEFEGCGNDILVNTEETGIIAEFSKKELNSIVVNSAQEFGTESIPWAKVREARKSRG